MAQSGVRFGTSGARGLVARMTNEVCYAYTAAFLQPLASDVNKVVLGHDLRPSSPAIASACAAAITDAGGQVVYAGALPTPALALYAAKLGVPALVITGSHIPFDRNGIKFYRADGEITKADEVAMQAAVVALPDEVKPQSLPQPDEGATSYYRQRYLDFFGAGALAGMRVAIYEHSSVVRDLLRGILEALGAQVISLGRTDTFVPIDTEAVRPEDVAQARQWALQQLFDAILSTDGDADRPLIGDEQGEWLRGDVVGILCAQYLNADRVVTPVSSNTAVERCGLFKKVVRTRIGSPYVIAAMQAEPVVDSAVVVGYEANGGFLLGSAVTRNGRRLNALPTRDAVLPMLALLCMARERGCKLSALTAQLPARYTASHRLQDFPSEHSLKLIDRLLNDPSYAMQILAPNSGTIDQIDTTDGLRISFSNGDIVHLRPSGNAPELRCYAEADSQASAQRLSDECLRRLQEDRH